MEPITPSLTLTPKIDEIDEKIILLSASIIYAGALKKEMETPHPDFAVNVAFNLYNLIQKRLVARVKEEIQKEAKRKQGY